MSNLSENTTGRTYWRSIAERADSPALREAMEKEFTSYDPDEMLSLSRRKFLMLAGASMALAGLTLTGCRRWPTKEIAPFNANPKDFVPNTPVLYASALERAGVGQAVLVVTFDGRPIKIETHLAKENGRPLFAAPSAFDQAEVLNMYDPDRLRAVRKGEESSAWAKLEDELHGQLNGFAATGGEGLVVLSEANSGPTMERLKAQFVKKFPKATWAVWEATGRANQAAGLKAAGLQGKLRPVLTLENADIIAAFDADLLGAHPSSSSNARGWAAGRTNADKVKAGVAGVKMNRLYAVEPVLSLTGTNSDERLAVKPSQVLAVLGAVAAGLKVEGVTAPDLASIAGQDRVQSIESFVARLVADLKAAGARAVVEAGPGQPAEAHALAAAINAKLGAVGTTVSYIADPSDEAGVDGLRLVAEALKAGKVESLIVLGGNPAFDAPRDLDFAQLIAKAKWSAHLSSHRNETSVKCAWNLPRAHAFESFGDARAWDGTILLRQPQILPLFEGRADIELAAFLAGETQSLAAATSRELVRKTFAKLDEKAWNELLQKGYAAGSAAKAQAVAAAKAPAFAYLKAEEVEMAFAIQGPLFDGRFANNGWIQELAQPVSKVTWDNPVFVSVNDAAKGNIKNEELLKVEVGGKTLELPAFIAPGQADGVLWVSSGHGRTMAGRVGGAELNGEAYRVGFDAYALRSSTAWAFAKASYANTGKAYRLAFTSIHHLINDGLDTKMKILGIGSDKTPKEFILGTRVGQPVGFKEGSTGTVVKEFSLEDYAKASFAADETHGNVRLQMFQEPGVFNDPHAWGMAIDANACTGCGACVIACQSENNIPNVGKDQVWRSREMHWLRIDTYYQGDPAAQDSAEFQAAHLPVTCVQCENAPCEQVCPVAATVHDTEGLNTMVYNRCIGTRYCSNNCPYKVRRFNYFDFHSKPTSRDTAMPWLNIPDTQQNTLIEDIRKLGMNPDVTVRMRGVMEKCTYCTQRITRAKVNARVEWAAGQRGELEGARSQPLVKEGEIVTACQTACATGAIVFGDLNDKSSKVYEIQSKNKRGYALLSDLNTRPRTRHLARIRNPHEKTLEARHLAGAKSGHGHGHEAGPSAEH